MARTLFAWVLITALMSLEPAHARPGMGGSYSSGSSSSSSGSSSSSSSSSRSGGYSSSSSSSGSNSSTSSSSSSRPRTKSPEEIRRDRHPAILDGSKLLAAELTVEPTGMLRVREKLRFDGSSLKGKDPGDWEGLRFEPRHGISHPGGWIPRLPHADRGDINGFAEGRLGIPADALARGISGRETTWSSVPVTDKPSLFLSKYGILPEKLMRGEAPLDLETDLLYSPGFSEQPEFTEIAFRYHLPLGGDGAPAEVLLNLSGAQGVELLGGRVKFQGGSRSKPRPVAALTLSQSGMAQLRVPSFASYREADEETAVHDLILILKVRAPAGGWESPGRYIHLERSVREKYHYVSQPPEESPITFDRKAWVRVLNGGVLEFAVEVSANRSFEEDEKDQLLLGTIESPLKLNPGILDPQEWLGTSLPGDIERSFSRTADGRPQWKVSGWLYGNWTDAAPGAPGVLSLIQWSVPGLKEIGYQQNGYSEIVLEFEDPAVLAMLRQAHSRGELRLELPSRTCLDAGPGDSCHPGELLSPELSVGSLQFSERGLSLRTPFGSRWSSGFVLGLPLANPTVFGMTYIRKLFSEEHPSFGDRTRASITSAKRLIVLIFGIPLCVLIAAGVIVGMRLAKRNQFSQTVSAVERLLQREDPSFSWKEFSGRVEQSAELLMTSWSEGRLERVRHFLSAGLFERFNTQLRLLREVDQVKNCVSDFKLVGLLPVGLETDCGYQTIHVRISASIKDVTVPTSAPQTTVGKALKEARATHFEEVYSFTRKLGSRTQSGRDPVVKHECPSCGAVAALSHASVRCEHCGVIFNSGEHDWVLSEITQMVEWKGTAARGGGADIHSGLVEDQASVIFWRLLASGAGLKGADAQLARVLPEGLSGSALLGSLQGAHSIPVVGSLDLMDFKDDPSGKAARFEVRWSSRQLTPRKDSMSLHRRSELGVHFSPEALESARGFQDESDCRGCGAPPTAEDSQLKCPWCGTQRQERSSSLRFESLKQL